MAGPRRRQKNDAIRESLATYGDDGAAERHIVHYAYPFPTADLSQRPAMISALQSQGFTVRDAATQDGLVMEHHGPVSMGDFDDFTELLERWFASLAWDFDGWECAVVRSIN